MLKYCYPQSFASQKTCYCTLIRENKILTKNTQNLRNSCFKERNRKYAKTYNHKLKKIQSWPKNTCYNKYCYHLLSIEDWSTIFCLHWEMNNKINLVKLEAMIFEKIKINLSVMWPVAFIWKLFASFFVLLHCRRMPYECKYSQMTTNFLRSNFTSEHLLKIWWRG